jgi:hypothetical protein
LFFSYFTSCGNINIHHIHICSDCLCLSNKLNLYYYHIFPMKHLIHLSKLSTIYHFMSIQTTNVVCIWRCLLWFFTWLCCFYGCHHGMLFLLSACLHIMIHHPIVCAMFVKSSVLIYVFVGVVCLILCGTKSTLLDFVIIMPFSHNIVASLCCYNVDCFIPTFIILRYDYKPTINIVIRK